MLDFLKPYLLAIELTIAALIIIGTNYVTYRLTSDSYIKDAQEQQIARDKASSDLIAHKDAQIHQGDIQHAQDQSVISDLAVRARRVQIHTPTNCDQNPQGGSDTDGASGLAAARNDAALAGFKQGMDNIGERCARLNADAIRSNTANQ